MPGSMLLRPPAGDSVTEACKRPWRKPEDDIQCFIGIKISIKIVPSRWLVKNNHGRILAHQGLKKSQATCLDKAKTGALLSERIFIPGHLEKLISSWWERENRVPKATPTEENT
jgi:hypothetical protein